MRALTRKQRRLTTVTSTLFSLDAFQVATDVTLWLICRSRDMIPYAASWVALSAAWSSSYSEHCFTMINYRNNSLILLMCFPHKINDVLLLLK